jgi:hypothetical protein
MFYIDQVGPEHQLTASGAQEKGVELTPQLQRRPSVDVVDRVLRRSSADPPKNPLKHPVSS